MTSDQDPLLTTAQAAVAAGVPEATVHLWIRAGRLHPVGPTGRRHERPSIRAAELAEALSRQDQWHAGLDRVWGHPGEETNPQPDPRGEREH